MTSTRLMIAALALLTLPATLACFGGGGRFSEERDMCDAYFDCLEELFPDQIGTARAAYGDDSACWDDRDAAEACSDGCRAAMAALGECEIPNGGGGGSCMETSDGSDFPDIFPDQGAPSSVGDAVYAQCEPYTGPVYIAWAPPASCSRGTWGLTFEHYGSSDLAYVYLYDAGGWGERHPVGDATVGPNAWYQRWSLDVEAAPRRDSVNPGFTTGVDCDPADNNVVVAYAVYGSSNQLLDCVVLRRDTSASQVSSFLSRFPELSDCEVADWWFEGQ